MTEEKIRNLIRLKIERFGYKSVKVSFALVKEERWKVLLARFVFQNTYPTKHRTLLELDDFVLEEFSLQLEQFNEFLNYTERGRMENAKIESHRIVISDDLLYQIGNYDLCMVGNFPSDDLYFYGSKTMSEYHGIDTAAYEIDWAINSQLSPKTRPKVELLDHTPPFRNYVEAINHYWGTNYESHGNFGDRCNLYFPIYDYKIKNCEIVDTKFNVILENKDSTVKKEGLNISIIANSKQKDFRDNIQVTDSIIEGDFGFEPTYANFYLHRKGQKLDVFDYYIPTPDTDIRIASMDTLESDEVILFDKEFLSQLPIQIQKLLQETQGAFNNKLYRASAILLRAVLEEGITLLIRKADKENELFNEQGYEMGLQKKIKLLLDNLKEFRQMKDDFDTIKWFGDKATHEASLPIYRNPIIDSLSPKIMLFLIKFVEYDKK